MNCYKCSEPLKTGAKFCNECGAKQQISCPSCGKALELGETVCQECAKQQTMPRISSMEFTPILPKAQENFVSSPAPMSQTTQALPLIKDLPPLHKGGLGEVQSGEFSVDETSYQPPSQLHRGGLGPIIHSTPRPVPHPAQAPLHQGSLGQNPPPPVPYVAPIAQTPPTANTSAVEEAPRGDVMIDACTEGDAKNRGFTLELVERGYRITHFNGRSQTPHVPAFVERVPVVELHRESFEAKGVNHVTIPHTVISIGDWCFADNSISKLDLPDSLRYVGLCAFKGNRITNITIPQGLKKIDEEAFECNKLTQVRLPQMLEYVGKSAFSYNNLTNIAIPGAVTFIGKHAFSYNQLNSVIISPGVAYIGDNAFAYNQLSSISIPYGVTEICDGAFYMNKLAKIIIPSSVHTIGANAFRSNQLAKVGIPQSVMNIHPQAFDKWVEIVRI